MQTKRRGKRKLSKASRLFLCLAMLSGTIYFLWTGLQELKTTADIRLNIEANRIKVQELDEVVRDLEKTKQKLANPDYIEYIARGKYLVTKEGEQVFKFPSNQDKDESE